jgi:excinuclease UvrABC ATPase subunit
MELKVSHCFIAVHDHGRSHLAVMAHADWIIDLGPGAGHDGGRVVFEGLPADLATARQTLTGLHLAEYVGTGASTVDRRS